MAAQALEHVTLVNARDAAEALDVQEKTLARWRWEGRGPRFVKVGRAVRYRACDLAAWVEARTRRSTSDRGAAA